MFFANLCHSSKLRPAKVSHHNFSISSGDAYELALSQLKHLDPDAVVEQSFVEDSFDRLYNVSAQGYSRIDSLEPSFCSRIKEPSATAELDNVTTAFRHKR